jgi:putative inorganic carbon (HCO3(-)) transporter
MIKLPDLSSVISGRKKVENRFTVYIEKTFETALLFFLAFSPLVFHTAGNDPFWVAEKFFFELSACCLAMIFAALCASKGTFPLIKTPYTAAFAVFMAANIAGIFAAVNYHAFLERVILNGAYLMIFYFVVYYAAMRPGNIKKVLISIMAPAFIMAIYGLVQALGMDFLPWKSNFDGRAASTLGNPNFLAGHMTAVIPLGLVLFVGTKSRLEKLLLFMAAGVMIAALLASQTRGAYIGFIVSVLLLGYLLIRYIPLEWRRIKTAAIACFVIFAVAAGGYFLSNREASKRVADIITLKDDSARIRALLWKNSLYLAADNILVGSGAGNFPFKYSYYQSRSLTPDYFRQSDFFKSGHAHNDFIQFFAEYGIFGGGAMLYFFWLIFYTGLRRLKKGGEGGHIIAGILSGTAALLVHAFFNFPFQIVPTTAAFYALVAAASFLQEDASITEVSCGTVAKYALGLAGVLILAAGVISFKPLIMDDYLRKAKEAEHFNRNYESVNFAEQAAEADPNSDETQQYYAQLLEKNGNYEKSFEAYKRSVSLNPGNWESLYGLFNFYAMKKDADGIRSTADKMYAISPYSEKAVTAKGYSLYTSGKLDEAAALYEKSIATMGERASILSQLSACYGALGNVQKTIEYARRAIAMDPGYIDAYYNLAVAYYRMRDMKDSRESLNAILKLSPGNEKALGLLKAMNDANHK